MGPERRARQAGTLKRRVALGLSSSREFSTFFKYVQLQALESLGRTAGWTSPSNRRGWALAYTLVLLSQRQGFLSSGNEDCDHPLVEGGSGGMVVNLLGPRVAPEVIDVWSPASTSDRQRPRWAI